MLPFIILVIFMTIMAIQSNMMLKRVGGGHEDVIRSSCMYGSDRLPIYMNLSSRTWITPIKTAILTKKIIDDLIPSGKVRLLDMTANCGGNLLPFVDDARYTGVGYEIDPRVFDILVQNVSQFPRAKKWEVRCASSVDDREMYDIIVVDPPFGDEYRTGVAYQPKLGDINMSELVREFGHRSKYIILKLPMIGFDVDGFVAGVGETTEGWMKMYTKEDLGIIDGKVHKIMLIVVDTSKI